MNDENLSLEELFFVSKEININEKSHSKAYLLATLLGWTGLHWIYLDSKPLAATRALLTLLTTLSILGLLNILNFYVSLWVVVALVSVNVIFSTIDLLLVDKVIKNINCKRESELIESFHQS